MPRVTHVKRARKPNSVVSKEDIDKARSGEDPEAASYYWWKHKLAYGGLRRESKKYPRPSQLTLSDYYSGGYAIQENAEDSSPSYEDLESWVDGIKDEVSELGEAQREKFDNMPEGLQMGNTGMLLEERADCCENIVSELESIDIPGEDCYVDETGDAEPYKEEEPEEHEKWTETKEQWESDQVDEVTSNVIDALQFE